MTEIFFDRVKTLLKNAGYQEQSMTYRAVYKPLQSLSSILVKPKQNVKICSCRVMTEMLLKAS